MKASNRRKKPKCHHFVLFFLTAIFSFFCDQFLRDFTDMLTLNLMLDFYHIRTSFTSIIQNVVYFIYSRNISLVALLLFYNYGTLAQVNSLFLNNLLTSCLLALLNEIYKDPRPFLVEYVIKPFTCITTWGNPSFETGMLTSQYLTIIYCIFNQARYENKLTLKIIVRFFTGVFIVFLVFLTTFLGLNSLGQNVFGAAVGFLTFYFIFYCLQLGDQSPWLTIYLIEMKKKVYFLIVLVVGIAYLFVYWLLPSRFEDKWEISLRQGCEFTHVCWQNSYDQAIFGNFMFNISFIGLIVGMKLDFKYNFKGDESSYIAHYFDKSVEYSEDVNFNGFMFENKWNETSFCIGLIRLLLIGGLSVALLLPYIWVNECDYAFPVGEVLKYFLPLFSFKIFLVFGSQLLVNFLNLGNKRLIDNTSELLAYSNRD